MTKEKSPLQILCEKLEHWETPEWAAKAILKKEILTHVVIDPCAGAGVLSEAAHAAGYEEVSIDVHNWGYALDSQEDFLKISEFTHKTNGVQHEFSVFMNPPFSLAEKFVEKSFELGARKVVCFQRFSWYEGSYDKGKKRGQWWEKNRPARIWLCGDRANCWRHDVPTEDRIEGTPTAHAFFVWEQGHAPAAITGHIYKS